MNTHGIFTDKGVLATRATDLRITGRALDDFSSHGHQQGFQSSRRRLNIGGGNGSSGDVRGCCCCGLQLRLMTLEGLLNRPAWHGQICHFPNGCRGGVS